MVFALLFNLWFYTILVIYSAIVIPLFSLIVLACRPFCTHRKAMYFFHRFITLYGRGIVSGLAWPVIRVHGKDFAPEPLKGGAVYICNHRSSSDPFLVSMLPGEVVQVVNKWPFHLPVWGPFAKWAGYINVRAMSVESFTTRVGDLLKQGTSVVAFPEGTRSASRRMGQFHGALFRACLHFGPPIVPVCFMGNENKPRRGSLLLHPGRVHVHALPPLHYEDYRDMSPFALKNHVRELMQQHMLRTEGHDDETHA